MHESGVALRAVQAALDRRDAAHVGCRPAGLDVLVDPARVAADSVAFHLELILRDLDLAGLPIVVSLRSVRCPGCGSASTAEAWLLCEACGAPLPAIDGPMVEAEFRY